MNECNNRWYSLEPLSGKLIPYGLINNNIINQHYNTWNKETDLIINLSEGEIPKPCTIILKKNGIYFQTTKAYNTHTIGDRLPGFRSVGMYEVDSFPFELTVDTYLSNYGEWRLHNYKGKYINPIYKTETLINVVVKASIIFESLPSITEEVSDEEEKIPVWFRSTVNPEDLKDTPMNSYRFYLSEEHNFKIINDELNNVIEKGYTDGLKKIKAFVKSITADIIYCSFNPKFALQIHTMGDFKRIRLLKRKLLSVDELEILFDEKYESEITCSICLEDIDSSKTKLPCNHEFCNICLYKFRLQCK